MKFMGQGEVDSAAAWRMCAHKHSIHEMIVVLSGGVKVNLAGRWLYAYSGDGSLIQTRQRRQGG